VCERHFGMKAHIGVDAHSGAVHTLETTPANTADINKGHSLLHGEEKLVFADAGYQGIEKRTQEITNPNAHGTWPCGQANARPWVRKRRPNHPRTGAVEILDQSLCGASLLLHQKCLWFEESSVQRLGQKHRTAIHPVCIVQLVDHKKTSRRAQRPRCVLSSRKGG
jgi:IS5 family transposase